MGHKKGERRFAALRVLSSIISDNHLHLCQHRFIDKIIVLPYLLILTIQIHFHIPDTSFQTFPVAAIVSDITQYFTYNLGL